MKKILSLLMGLTSIAIQAQTLVTSGSMATQRWQHESQMLPNGNIVAFGGNDCYLADLTVHASAELYTVSTGTWSAAASMSTPRYSFASVVLPDGKILAMGGNNRQQFQLKKCELFDPATMTWSPTADLITGRSYFQAVVLQNGLVLVAGGASSSATELYDPITNTWLAGGNMEVNHGSSMALTLLKDGRVLATGGENARKTAEIFDPVNMKWTKLAATTVSERMNHYGTLLPDGTVLLTGTGGGFTAIKTEIFNPITNAFSATGDLLELIGDSRPQLLDNGTVALFYIGDAFTPGDTKALQIYHPATKLWTSQLYTSIGSQGFTINKLANGKVLITGGSFTTGNGALKTSLLLLQDDYTACTIASVSVNTITNTTCVGATNTVTLLNSVPGYQYTLHLNNTPVSTAVAGNGSNINLQTDSRYIFRTNTLLTVQATIPGCPAIRATPAVSLQKSTLAVSSFPVLTRQDSLVCNGDSVKLSSTTLSGYTVGWSNGKTGASVHTRTGGLYAAYFKDNNGCQSAWSKWIQVLPLPDVAPVAGTNNPVCADAEPFQLTGFSPAYGTWSGPGVSSAGKFTPAAAGEGIKTLTYTYCHKTATTAVTVGPPSKFPIVLDKTRDTICQSRPISVTVKNSLKDVYYYLNGSSGQRGTGDDLWFSGGYPDRPETIMNVSGTRMTSCATSYSYAADTIVMLSFFLTPGQVKVIAPDTVCVNTKAEFKIPLSDKNLMYSYLDSTGFSYQSVRGTGSTLSFRTVTDRYGYYSIEVNNLRFCKSTPVFYKTIPMVSVYPFISAQQEGYSPGEPITLKNTTFGDQHFWQMPGASATSSNLRVPLPFSYSQTGEKKIRYQVSSKWGCSATDSFTVLVANPLPQIPGGICASLDPAAPQGTGHFVADGTTDPSGNIITVGYTKVYDPFFLSGDMPVYFIRKQDKKGQAKWIKFTETDKINYPDKHGASFIHTVATDSKGNIYVGGSFLSENFPLGDLRLKSAYKNSGNTRSFIAKLDSSGKYMWAKAFEDVDCRFCLHAATDMQLLNDHLYVSFGNQNINYNDTLAWVGKFDLNGNLVKRTNLKVLDGYNTTGGAYYNPRSSTYTYQLTNMNPKLHVFSDDKVLLFMEIKGSVASPFYTLDTKGESAIYQLTLSFDKGLTQAVKVPRYNQQAPLPDIQVNYHAPSESFYVVDQGVRPEYMNDGYWPPSMYWNVWKINKNNLVTAVTENKGSKLTSFTVDASENLILTGYFDKVLKLNDPSGGSYLLGKPGNQTGRYSFSFTAKRKTSGLYEWATWTGDSASAYEQVHDLVMQDACQNILVYLKGSRNINASAVQNFPSGTYELVFPATNCQVCNYGNITSIETIKQETVAELRLYPNPCHETIHLKLSDTEAVPVSYAIYGSTGSLADKGITENGIIQVEKLPNGFYVLRTGNGSSARSYPFVKQ